MLPLMIELLNGVQLDWPQLVGIGAVLLIGLLGNRLRTKRRSQSRSQSSRRAPGPGRTDIQVSPGQFGLSATRDLEPDEIRSIQPSYSPSADGAPDPGEVVWTWVPYAEHDGRGKDRPVLIFAHIDAASFAGCYLSTKDHRGFVSIGSGGWDPQGRESFLATDRVLMVHAQGMRREGHVLPRERFDRAVQVIAQRHRIGR